jgi:hypothetical protein
MNTTIRNDVRKMVRESLALLPFLHPSSATTTTNLQQTAVTGSSRIPPAVRVQTISPNAQQQNANANPVNTADEEAPMRINRWHSSIHGRRL